MYTLVLSVKGREFFYITGNFVPCYIKTLRGMRTRAKQKFVAKATALGARVPRAELFVYFTWIARWGHISWQQKHRIHFL